MDIYLNIMLLFYIFCFAGWIWESIYMSFVEKKLTNRGFLNGPYIPIYGFGGLAIYLVFQQYQTTFFSKTSIYIYITGLIFATVLEYFTSVAMEIIFKARWWDYTDKPFNLNGRICLESSLFWGFLSVLFVQTINPLLFDKLNLLTHDLRLIITTAITTTIIIDIGVTIISIVNLQQRITAIVNFEKSVLQNLKDKIEDIKDASYKKVLMEYRTRVYNITNPFTKRLLSAYPKLKFISKERQTAFDKILEIRNKFKRKK